VFHADSTVGVYNIHADPYKYCWNPVDCAGLYKAGGQGGERLEPDARLRAEIIMDLFISYSREDKAFATNLLSALEGLSLTCWIDLDDIPPSVEWMNEIESGILGADAFLVVLSPRWLASVICASELALALRHSKKIIPIVIENVAESSAPTELAKLNWIFCRPSDPFEQAIALVNKALKLDIEHARSHTRLLLRAIEWQSVKRETSRLLRSQELHQAERWLAEAGTKEPPATNLHRQFILESRRVAAAETSANLQRISAEVLEKRPFDVQLAALLGLEAVRLDPTASSRERLYAALALCAPKLDSFAQHEVDHLAFYDPVHLVAQSPTKLVIRSLRKPEGDAAQDPLDKTQELDLLQMFRSQNPQAADQVSAILLNLRDAKSVFILQNGRILGDTVSSGAADHGEPIKIARFSPRYGFLATLGRDYLSIWRGDDLMNKFRLRLDSIFEWRPDVYSIGFSPDEKYLALGRAECASVLDLSTGKIVCDVDHFASFGVDTAIVALDAQNRLATGLDQTVMIWSIEDPKDAIWQVELHSRVSAVALSDGGGIIGISTSDGVARVWDWRTNVELARLPHGFSINSLAISPHERAVATAGANDEVIVWHLDPIWRAAPRMEAFEVNSYDLAPDASAVVYFEKWRTGWKFTVREPGSKRVLAQFDHLGRDEVAVSRNASLVAFQGVGFEIPDASTVFFTEVRDVKTAQLMARFEFLCDMLELTFGWTTSKLALCGFHSVTIADLTREPAWILGLYLDEKENDFTITGVPSNLSNQLMKGDKIRTIDGVDIRSMSLEAVLSLLRGGQESVVALRVERAGTDGLVDITARRQHRSFDGMIVGQIVDEVARFGRDTISFTDEIFARISPDGTIKITDIALSKEIAVLQQTAEAIALSADGRLIALLKGQTLQVKRWEDNLLVFETAVEKGSTDRALLAFSADGRRLAAGFDKTLVVWDLDGGREVHNSRFHAGAVAIALSPTGDWLVATSDQPMTDVMRPVLDELLISNAGKFIGRVLTKDEWIQYLPDFGYDPANADVSAEPESPPHPLATEQLGSPKGTPKGE